jgi:hypothetical protein
MPSILKWFHTGAVIAIRRKRTQETGTSTSHPNPTSPDLLENVSCSKSRRFEAIGATELALPLVGAAVGAIPVVGTPLKAAVDVLLYVIQTTDVSRLYYFTTPLLIASQAKNRNKAALDGLASRLRRLSDFLSQELQPRNEVEVGRRAELTKWVFMLKSCLSNDTIPRSECSKLPRAN